MGQDWTEDLRNRMRDCSIQEPEGLWESISASLPPEGTGHSAVPGRHDLRRRIAVIVASAAAAAGLVLMLHFAFHAREDVHVMIAESGIIQDGMNHPGYLAVKEIPAPGALMPAGDRAKAGMQEEYGQPDAVVAQDTIQETEDNGDIGQCPDGNGVIVQEIPKRYRPEQDWQAAEPFILPSDIRRKSIISTDIYFSNSLGSAYGNSGYASLLSSSEIMRQDVVNDLLGHYDAGEVTFYSGGEDLKTEVRHRPPVRAGVSVRYGLGKRWSIESGLTYAMLSSDVAAGTSSNRYETERRFHYVGIPFRANFDFLQRKRWSLYISAGGMAEKCVSGRSDTDYIVNGAVRKNWSEKISVKEIQWSVGASAGVEFDFVPSVGVYVEPGIGYYFDNGGGHETVYSSRPLNFTLEFGLRFNLM